MCTAEQVLSRVIFYNTLLFNVFFALILFVAAMRFRESFQQDTPVFKKAIVIGIFHQYVILPIYAFAFTWLLHTSMEVTLAIFLLVSFSNNKFALIITWISGGSTLYAVVLAFFSIVLSVSLTPFIFYALMHLSPITQSIAIDYTYFEYFSLIWGNRVDFLWMMIPAVLLGMLVGKYYSAVYELIENKFIWLAFLFAVCVSFVTIGQRPDFFTDYWHLFSWKLFFYSVSIFVISFGVSSFFGLPKHMGLALMICSGKYLIPITIILLVHWYPSNQETLWLVYAQLGVTQWLFLILVFYLRYKIQKEKHKLTA